MNELLRVLRGGSWLYFSHCLPASKRIKSQSSFRYDADGFRLVVRIKDE